MEKDQGPPEDTPAPPYPGPPMGEGVYNAQPGFATAPPYPQPPMGAYPPQPGFQTAVSPGPPMGPTGYPPQPGFQTAPPYPQPPMGAYPPQPGFQTGPPMGPTGYPPPPGFPTGPGTYPPVQQQPVPLMSHMVVIPQPGLTEVSGQMNCPHCENQVVTETRHTRGPAVWILTFMLFIVGCWPCCLIPLFLDSFKDVEHICPNCKRVIHIYRAQGETSATCTSTSGAAHRRMMRNQNERRRRRRRRRR